MKSDDDEEVNDVEGVMKVGNVSVGCVVEVLT